MSCYWPIDELSGFLGGVLLTPSPQDKSVAGVLLTPSPPDKCVAGVLKDKFRGVFEWRAERYELYYREILCPAGNYHARE